MSLSHFTSLNFTPKKLEKWLPKDELKNNILTVDLEYDLQEKTRSTRFDILISARHLLFKYQTFLSNYRCGFTKLDAEIIIEDSEILKKTESISYPVMVTLTETYKRQSDCSISPEIDIGDAKLSIIKSDFKKDSTSKYESLFKIEKKLLSVDPRKNSVYWVLETPPVSKKFESPMIGNLHLFSVFELVKKQGYKNFYISGSLSADPLNKIFYRLDDEEIRALQKFLIKMVLFSVRKQRERYIRYTKGVEIEFTNFEQNGNR